ncbi:hypothetical protein AAFF_G00396900 [Aldrovandia affinis]|uniref:Uncharacterized protein n=1 Tax=Aldrovandia affinis TaxID=143900 RepID=A0AAD7SCY9_9TELE|nr:hypothetical protein AAFF_G00396900 [Aldrovandia affinis]
MRSDRTQRNGFHGEAGSAPFPPSCISPPFLCEHTPLKGARIFSQLDEPFGSLPIRCPLSSDGPHPPLPVPLTACHARPNRSHWVSARWGGGSVPGDPAGELPLLRAPYSKPR